MYLLICSFKSEGKGKVVRYCLKLPPEVTVFINITNNVLCDQLLDLVQLPQTNLTAQVFPERTASGKGDLLLLVIP